MGYHLANKKNIYKRRIHLVFFWNSPGLYKVPYTWYSSYPHLFLNTDFIPRNVGLLPPLNILPNSLNIKKMILLHPSLFSPVLSFPTAMIFPSCLHNLIFFPTDLKNSPPTTRGDKELYTPLDCLNILVGGLRLRYQGLESDCGILTTPTPPPRRRKFIVPHCFQFPVSESYCSMVFR